MSYIEVDSITKKYSDVIALNNVSFSIQKGELFCLLGENGAGKTTLIRILSTLVKPTDGNVFIKNQKNIYNNRLIKRYLGTVTDSAKPYPNLTVKENIDFFSLMYSNNASVKNDRTEALINLLELEEYTDKKVDLLSKGNKQKVAIAKALCGEPEILIFDEPMSGLDVGTQKTIRGLMSRLQKNGKTIIFSSHNMEEVRKIADRICILNKGSIVYDGYLSDIKNEERVTYLENMLTRKG